MFSIHDDASVRTRALVMEPEEALRHEIGRAMRFDGFEVFEARDGKELLAILGKSFRRRWPSDDLDLIVIDLSLPGSDSLEIAAALRRAGWTTPLLLIALDPDDNLRRQAEGLSAHLLVRPFGASALRNATLRAMRMMPTSVRSVPAPPR
jgi:DNA-binding response OmpR family regulator